ncbi:MAG: MFS transporter [Tepidisphaerales bacterium]
MPEDLAQSPPDNSARTLRALKAQFFISFAVLGAFWPYLSVYFQERGLSDSQIGWVFAAACVPNIFSPFATTLLADTRLNARRLLAWLFVLGGVTMGLLHVARGFWAILGAFVLYRATYASILPLQDGINFSLQESRRSRGIEPVPYHRVRIWGSIGYMAPSFIIYLLMQWGCGTSVSLSTTIALCAMAALNLLVLLPALPDPAADAAAGAQLPSLQAIRVLARPPLRIFCIAMFILWVGVTAWATFYPIRLKELGVPVKWLGPVSSISIAIEIVFVAFYGRILERLGLRRVMLLGAGAAAVRFALLAVPHPAVAIATQMLHGPWVLALFVAPQSFINRNAGDRFRHSMQGIYTMFISGLAVMAGNLLCGWVMQRRGAAALFYVAAACALVAMFLLWMAFHEEHREA